MRIFTKLLVIIVAIAISYSYTVNAQVSINTDGSAPAASAMLDVKSNTKGMLMPRMTLAEIRAISNPADGLMVYNTDYGLILIYILADNKWKEVQYGSGEISLPATYTIGTGGSCANTTVNANYYGGVALVAANTVTLEATVTQVGTWSITTNTVNGYYFSAVGTFTTTGIIQVTLAGSGTPVTAQTDNFTATAYGGGTCTFSVTVEVNTCGSLLSYGGQNYTTVLIGSQCWMAQNLNIGTMIAGNTDQTDNGTIEKYCYDNNTSNCSLYGGLYQWNEMMQYSTGESIQGICPAGWHLPSDNEVKTLEMQLGMSQSQADATSWRGTNEGSKLAGLASLWTDGALDSDPGFGTSNFAALPGGLRSYANSLFYNMGDYALFWTSSENGASGRLRELIYSQTRVGRFDINKFQGTSVRCVKD